MIPQARLPCHVFGLNASPFLLNATLRHHILKFKNEDPEFVRRIHCIHKWPTRGRKLVPNHENEALEDNKHKFLTDSTVLVNLQSGDFFFL